MRNDGRRGGGALVVMIMMRMNMNLTMMMGMTRIMMRMMKSCRMTFSADELLNITLEKRTGLFLF